MKKIIGKTLKTISVVFFLSAALSYLFRILVISDELRVLSSDYVSYFKPGVALFDGRFRELYSIDYQRQIQTMYLSKFDLSNTFMNPFPYPPLVSFVFVPFLAFNIITSYKLVALITLILNIVAVVLLTKMSSNHKSFDAVFLLLLIFPPVYNSIFAPQPFSVLITLVVFGIYKSLKSGKDKLAAFLSAVLFIKPQYLLLVPFSYILSKDKKIYLKTFLPLISVFGLLNFALIGFDGTKDYLDLLRITDTPEFGNRPWLMYSATSVFTNLGLFDQSDKTSLGILNIGLYILFVAVAFLRSKKLSKDVLFSSGVIFSIFFAHHVLVHDLNTLMLPLVIILNLKISRLIKTLIILIIYIVSFGYLTGNTLWFSVLLAAVGCFLLFAKIFEGKSVVINR